MNRYPGRLHHRTPAWLETGATFHIRLRVLPATETRLTDPKIAEQILSSTRHYHDHNRWACRLFLLMPDHIHALLIFPVIEPMGAIIGSRKGYHAKTLGIAWQNNFFDHRIRHQAELKESEAYIRHNPVRKGYCLDPNAWPWIISCAQ